MRKRTAFSHSKYRLQTMEMGTLTPCMTPLEVLPGDTIRKSSLSLIRNAPLATPVMHPCFIRIHDWFVPFRLLWENWPDFITGGEDGLDASVVPVLQSADLTRGCLCDYLGIPPDNYGRTININAYAARAYALIFNERYRDQQIDAEIGFSMADGVDSTTNVALQSVRWPKDYFTAARTDQQLGSDVTIPLVGDAPVGMDGSAAAQDIGILNGSDNAVRMVSNTSFTQSTGTTQTNVDYQLQARLAAASGVPLNSLRNAAAVQRFQEDMNMFGARFDEYLTHAFGVSGQDARLQNPEYLGGASGVIQFSEVLSTDGANTGDMKGHGIALTKARSYQRFIPEHGLVLSFMSVVPKSIYCNAIDRHYLKRSKEDHFQPQLQFLGDQEITNEEVQIEHSTPDGIFGYTGRYDEYRSSMSDVAGEFGKGGTQTDWHYGRIYSGDQALNPSWLTCTPTKRTQVD